MTPTAELGDPSKAAGEGMIAAPAHLSLSELQPPQGRNQPQKGEGGGWRERGGSRKGRGKKEKGRGQIKCRRKGKSKKKERGERNKMMHERRD